MILEFVLDVVSHLSDQSDWWLSRGAIVRWARGYRAELAEHENGKAGG